MDALSRHAMVRGAWMTVATLFGGLLVGLGTGNLLFHLLPGSNVMAPHPLHAVVAAIPTAVALAAGSAAWGIQMGKLAGAVERRRMAITGILGFVPIVLIVAFSLLGLERVVIERAQLPIHRVFTLLFVPSAFVIAAVGGWALGTGLRDSSLAWRLWWTAGLAAAAAFLIVNLAMEAAGWVVGAPGADKRATMIVVMSLGNLAAALTAGAMLGRILVLRRR